MAKKIQDDYYSNIQTEEDTSNASVKKVVVKKKLKLKAKKPEAEVPEASHSQAETPSKVQAKSQGWARVVKKKAAPEKAPIKEQTLNDALNKKSTSKFTVVSRGEDAPKGQKNTSWTSGKSESKTRSSDRRQESHSHASGGDRNTSSAVKKVFKPRGEVATGSRNSQDETGKKSKHFSKDKSRKYKKQFDDDASDTGFVRSGKMKHKKKEEKKAEDIKQNLTTRTGETVTLPEFVSVKEFSEKIGIPLPKLIAEFMKNGMMMTINAQVDFDTASLIAEAFEITLEREAADGIGAADIATGNIKDLLTEEDTSKLSERPPVVSIMGHVDHGKTSLLDHIRKAKVAAGEAGGITQSIGAYQVEYNEKKITFLDTPGHEAFTVMRSRGAKSTDIAILVVAADEGVKPQTKESISHAKEAGIPVVVAINKMDKEGANPDHVKGQLSEHGLVPEDWGGDTPMVPVSAHTGFGIDELLEIILLVAEMQELKANPNRAGVATVIESHLDTQLGPVATVLMNTGTINKGDALVCGDSYGKLKLLKEYTGKSIKLAGPGDPVLIVGLDKVVGGGDILQVVSGIDVARQKAIEFSEYQANQKKMKSSQLDILMSKIKSGNLKHLKVVLKSDTNGSLEAIKNALLKLSTEETSVTIIHSGVGNITEGDVLMCGGSSAILVGFGVGVGPNAKKSLEDSGVEYIESKIIYHITERIEKIVSGMLDPKEIETVLCQAKVGAIFYTSKKFIIAGLILTQEDSSIENNTLVRVIRWDKVVGKGKIESLKQGVEEVKKLEGPIECGVKLTGYTAVEEKDILEVYKISIEK